MSHGTTGYKKGCRCADCRRANAAAKRRWRATLKAAGWRRQHGVTITVVEEDPLEWATNAGIEFRGDVM